MEDFFGYIARMAIYNLRYLARPLWDTGIPVPELMDFISRHSAGSVLDLGCGTGTNMAAFLDAGWKVDGVDIAFLAIVKAKHKITPYSSQGRVFLRGVTRLDFLSEKYDLIYDIGCYHALKERERYVYLANIKRLLQKNGHFLIYGFWRTSDTDFGIGEKDIKAFKDFMEIQKVLEGKNQASRSSIYLECRLKSKRNRG